MIRWILRLLVALSVAYLLLLGGLLLAMLQPPARFGQIMKRLPQSMVWSLLPAPSLWLWARQGSLEPGDPAPDFTLRRLGQSETVTLSSHRGQRPVVLVFGSYT